MYCILRLTWIGKIAQLRRLAPSGVREEEKCLGKRGCSFTPNRSSFFLQPNPRHRYAMSKPSLAIDEAVRKNVERLSSAPDAVFPVSWTHSARALVQRDCVVPDYRNSIDFQHLPRLGDHVCRKAYLAMYPRSLQHSLLEQGPKVPGSLGRLSEPPEPVDADPTKAS